MEETHVTLFSNTEKDLAAESGDDQAPRSERLEKDSQLDTDSEKEKKEAELALKQLARQRLLRLVLKRVADSAGFLVEERLRDLLAPYSETQQTIIRLDNVFNVCT